MDLNFIGAIVGVIGGVVGLLSIFMRAQNKIASNDLTLQMKYEELHALSESNKERIDRLEKANSDSAIVLAEIKKDIHYIAETIRQKGV